MVYSYSNHLLQDVIPKKYYVLSFKNALELGEIILVKNYGAPESRIKLRQFEFARRVLEQSKERKEYRLIKDRISMIGYLRIDTVLKCGPSVRISNKCCGFFLSENIVAFV